MDTDGDLISDLEEIRDGTDPLDVGDDTDGDGLYDDAEKTLWGIDPNNTDSDGDGIDDGTEVADGWDPAYADADNDNIHTTVDCDDNDDTSNTPWIDCPDSNDLLVDGRRFVSGGALSYRAVYLINGGTIQLRRLNNSGKWGDLTLSADFIYIDETSGITATGKGYSAGGIGSDGDGDGAGYSDVAGGGGAHYGDGMSGSEECETGLGNGGIATETSDVTDLLYGGGGAGGDNGVGGVGGGAIYLDTDILRLEGRLYARGISPIGSWSSRDGGAGAGGTVVLETANISCGDNARIDVRGGDGVDTRLAPASLSSSLGGAGGGGRIIVNTALGNADECLTWYAIRTSGGRGGCDDRTGIDGAYWGNGVQQ